MKEIDISDSYIKSKEESILKIKNCVNFTDQEKQKLIARYKNELDKLRSLQSRFEAIELRRIKERQLSKFYNYETLKSISKP